MYTYMHIYGYICSYIRYWFGVVRSDGGSGSMVSVHIAASAGWATPSAVVASVP